MPIRSRMLIAQRHGFSLLELLVALVIASILMVGIHRLFNTSQNIQAIGLDLSEAQQNARIARATLEKELRLAGFGIPPHVQVPILVASEYRVTFVRDRNANGVVDLGETITYFLDPNTSVFAAASTPNPRDMVLRRVASDSLNTNAQPISGYGDIVACGITQQTDDDGTLDVPMFGYFDEHGNSLMSSAAYDPCSAAFGYTISDSIVLGRPPGGANQVMIKTIAIRILCESEAVDEFLDDYQRVNLTTLVAPRNLPLNLREYRRW